jgi:hypothetical protein
MVGRLSKTDQNVRKGAVIPRQSHQMGSDIDVREAQAARIASVYRERKTLSHPGGYGEANALREQILKLSLFPNIYNKSELLRHG